MEAWIAIHIRVRGRLCVVDTFLLLWVDRFCFAKKLASHVCEEAPILKLWVFALRVLRRLQKGCQLYAPFLKNM